MSRKKNHVKLKKKKKNRNTTYTAQKIKRKKDLKKKRVGIVLRK